MDLYAILSSTPIDRVARRVTSQVGAAEADMPLTREELAALVSRLCRKQRLLKRVLGIRNKSQHRNTTYKARRGIRQIRAKVEPRALTEYMRCGQEIARLNAELAALRKVRQFVARAEQECKALAGQRLPIPAAPKD